MKTIREISQEMSEQSIKEIISSDMTKDPIKILCESLHLGEERSKQMFEEVFRLVNTSKLMIAEHSKMADMVWLSAVITAIMLGAAIANSETDD